MKINCNNQDLKIINWNRGHQCISCELNHTPTFYQCNLVCHFDKIWIKDIFNSDIFRL